MSFLQVKTEPLAVDVSFDEDNEWEDWLDEHRIRPETTLKWNWGEFKLSDRNNFRVVFLR